MSHLQYFDYPNFGTRAKRDLNSSKAVRVNNVIEISGQGGWDPKTEVIPEKLSDEIDQAFSNVQLALETAGGKGWEGVYKLRVYISVTGEDGWPEFAEHIVRNLRKWCPVSEAEEKGSGEVETNSLAESWTDYDGCGGE